MSLTLGLKLLATKPICSYCISRYHYGNPRFSPNNERNLITSVRHASWMRKTVLKYLIRITRGYEDVLQKRFPRTFKIYRIFTIGAMTFYKDVREFVRIARDLRQGRNYRSLNVKEIEVYHEMPKEIMRVTPILIIASFPFSNYFIFPLAYWFPRHLLSPHFWSLQQRVDFAIIFHKKRLHYYQPVFRNLQAKTNKIKDKAMRQKCLQIFHKLGSGIHPTVEEILATKSVYETKPFQLNHLSYNHLGNLCRIHGMTGFGLRRRKLRNYGRMLYYLDLALVREDIRTLIGDEMRKACFVRGLNPVGMQRVEMVSFLQQWMRISEQVTTNSVSLLLHCPILLTYNQPTNWSLINRPTNKWW